VAGGGRIFLGLATRDKWDAAWYIIGVGALTIAWDIGARRAAGLRIVRPRGAARRGLAAGDVHRDPAGGLHRHLGGWFAPAPATTADYAQLHGVSIPVISPLYSLFAYHREAISFGLA